MTIAELLRKIFDHQPPFWVTEFEDWIRTSRRFRAFAETYQDKIHKKLRTIRDDASLKDFYYELETACRLLQDRRFTIEYEKYNSLKRRGPDFTVAFRVNTLFNLEVTRIRISATLIAAAPEETEASIARKVAETVCEKLGQLQSNMVNILMVIVELPLSESKLLSAINALRIAAERKQDDYFVARRFQNAADFLKQYRDLSAIVCRCERAGEPVFWHNSLAKRPLPNDLVNAIQKAFL